METTQALRILQLQKCRLGNLKPSGDECKDKVVTIGVENHPCVRRGPSPRRSEKMETKSQKILFVSTILLFPFLVDVWVFSLAQTPMEKLASILVMMILTPVLVLAEIGLINYLSD